MLWSVSHVMVWGQMLGDIRYAKLLLNPRVNKAYTTLLNISVNVGFVLVLFHFS